MATTQQTFFESINPASEQVLARYPGFSAEQVGRALVQARWAFRSWRDLSVGERALPMRRAATYLRENRDRLARLITLEMGKPITEAEAEIEKCAWAADFYAENAASYLEPEPRVSNATESYITFEPLGTILAIMPWNFPFWQAFRAGVPALMAGNTVVLKHSSNVPQSALAVEEVFRAAGFPEGTFRTLLISGSEAEGLVADPRIAAVTLTGSDVAGSHVAVAAGRVIKKSVLELGGSDPYIVLADADLEAAAAVAVVARNRTAGQTCIAAKRMLIEESVYDDFRERFLAGVRGLVVGDPLEPATQLGPLARADLVSQLERQVNESVRQGARVLLGGGRLSRPGYFFAPTVLADVTPDMPVFREETFGPVASLIRVRDEEQAVRLANDTPYGLSSALWTRDVERAKRLGRRIEAGNVFINGMSASDPRLPFGGVKRSGYGRELSEFGIREFVNIKTIWVGPEVKSPPAGNRSE
ncbi:MAG: NAD-dependent succinate-semialdehyde dehydrogenase [Chloroflexi bacterium]|nr:NAD-dependent succinate-semialdehyde dehydrogenase [Chloroflexota bacterium]MCL5109525.1 NAD-dependent succinate-semialdehyde dehydrogenase [Chloroflexota bacterium]